MIDRLGLTHGRRKRPLREYSKGMVRRVGLAQCLINDPEFIIFDEPTSGMDPIGSREIKDLILDLKRQKKTVLLSSHLLADVEDVCDRVAMLYRGRLQLEGRVSELLEDQNTVELSAEGLSGTATEAIKAQMLSQGGKNVTVRRRRERLESLFPKVVEREQGKIAAPISKRGD